MQFDIFLSICQTEVDGYFPTEKVMFDNFFDQVQLADQLGFGTAWLAETHLSCEIQKQNANAVIPDFKGEIGLNTDVLQMAHIIFAKTKNINVGSAIRNILCNGGPIAHAEAISTFLSLHSRTPEEKRTLELGFASGRFEFSNRPYGIVPRNEMEKVAWPVMKGKIFQEATEIFLRLLKGETLSTEDISRGYLERADFRTDEHWEQTLKAYGSETDRIEIAPRWNFEKLAIIPKDKPLELLNLTIGAHDAKAQALANKFYPCGVFNLSITPTKAIEETHERMKGVYHADGGEWSRQKMPRTVLIFINDETGLSDEEKDAKARKAATHAIANYWKAMAGTLDEAKVNNAVNNALVGSPGTIMQQMKSRFNPEDRLMCWFDFNNHNNEQIKADMQCFMEKVVKHF